MELAVVKPENRWALEASLSEAATGRHVTLDMGSSAFPPPAWMTAPGRQVVQVRWLAPRGPFLIESARGELALVVAGWRRG